MPTYLLEGYLPPSRSEDLSAAATRASEAASAMRDQGYPVRHLGSMFIPVDQIWLCLFEGPSPEVVRQANDRADNPCERIVELVLVAREPGTGDASWLRPEGEAHKA